MANEVNQTIWKEFEEWEAAGGEGGFPAFMEWRQDPDRPGGTNELRAKLQPYFQDRDRPLDDLSMQDFARFQYIRYRGGEIDRKEFKDIVFAERNRRGLPRHTVRDGESFRFTWVNDQDDWTDDPYVDALSVGDYTDHRERYRKRALPGKAHRPGARQRQDGSVVGGKQQQGEPRQRRARQQ